MAGFSTVGYDTASGKEWKELAITAADADAHRVSATSIPCVEARFYNNSGTGATITIGATNPPAFYAMAGVVDTYAINNGNYYTLSAGGHVFDLYHIFYEADQAGRTFRVLYC